MQEVDDRIVDAADQYRRAACLLMETISERQCILPLFTIAAFAIELYFKALNATTMESPGPSPDSFWLTSKPNQKGHTLEPLFLALHATHRNGLEQAFRASLWSSRAASLRDALLAYNTMFEDSRYQFEATTA